MSFKGANAPTSPQLLIKEYHHNEQTFAHCLICSTAPKNAESRYREELWSKRDSDYHRKLVAKSLENLENLKVSLTQFISDHWSQDGRGVLDKIKIVLQIHGFNVPLESVEEDYGRLSRKFYSDTSDKSFSDYVIFINFSWPSEKIIVSQLFSWLRALPLFLLLALLGLVVLISTFWFGLQSIYGRLALYSFGLVIGGLVLALVLLRLIVYFRDRDRAASYGVFDTVELVRWLQVILQDSLQEVKKQKGSDLNQNHAGTVDLSFVAHSMGCFVTTQAVRMLADVFDPSAIKRWKDVSNDGPFAKVDAVQGSCLKQTDSQLNKIGNFFVLKSLVLASPDIPVWAISSSRSNFLLSCIRRFKNVYFFTNNADIILRLASTAANYFVFPSNSRIGGYRLGNLTVADQRKPGSTANRANDLGIRSLFKKIHLPDNPFCSSLNEFFTVTVVDCTDYKDQVVGSNGERPHEHRLLSAFTSNNAITDLLNYIATVVLHAFQVNQLDSHGGYFRGKFCLDLIYGLALNGEESARGETDQNNFEELYDEPARSFDELLKRKQITWISCKTQQN
jgi:hypothetical protein